MGDEIHDLRSVLGTKDRDFLVRNNGDQVKISDVVGKVVGLYFSATWCGPCHRFTPKLVEAYNELSQLGDNFEIVFISADEDDESFTAYFSEMPWLAVPFLDSKARDSVDELFNVSSIPFLVILDGDGKVLTTEGVQFVRDYGADSYPFTSERIQRIKVEEEAAKQNQTLKSLLVSSSRDYLITVDGDKVPVADLEGKVVGIYFSICSFNACHEFTNILVDMYKKLKEQGQNFEVVLVSMDDEESIFKQAFAEMPWLALPFKDKTSDKLIRYFELESVPTLVIIGPNGKTLCPNAAEIVEEYKAEAYPFSPEKLQELAEKEKAKQDAQTLESLLVSGQLDFVIGHGGIKVPVSTLVGKNILIYFSAQWCPPCRAFLPKLIDTYHKIKEKDNMFEVIFVSSDQDQSSFDDFFQEMPWLALPFEDERKKSLNRTFKIQGIPSLVAIDSAGKTISKEVRELVTSYGPVAYPFTQERIQALNRELEEKAREWPEKLMHKLHEEHELLKTRRKKYFCDDCEEEGTGWSYYCGGCDFDLHPKCALETDKQQNNEDLEEHEQSGKEGYVCDGEVCYKV